MTATTTSAVPAVSAVVLAGGWAKVPYAVLDRIPDIRLAGLGVYVMLVRHADAAGFCYPSIGRVATALGVSESTVRRALRRLGTCRLVKVIHRQTDFGDSDTNGYVVSPSGVLADQTPPPSKPDTTSSQTRYQGGVKRDTRVVSNEIGELDPIEQDPPNTPARAGSLDKLIHAWNAIPGVIHCREATAKRRTAFRQRVGSDGWWKKALTALPRIAASDFLQGNGERGWRADLDWLLRPDSVAHVLEGKYDNRDSKPNGPIQTSFS